MLEQIKKQWRGWVKGKSKNGFTLPEVIVSFSVMVLVIVSATNVLTLVMRTNSDNVDSMMAYGLAQEGLESFRFMRDSNAVLGLKFDGTTKGAANLRKVWDEPLMDLQSGGNKYFVLIDKTPVGGCSTTNLADCMPVGLKAVSGDLDALVGADQTLVYLNKLVSSERPFQYFQTGLQSMQMRGVTKTKFHRLLVVEPLKNRAGMVNAVRLSSMVFWNSGNVTGKKVVLTTELTDWK